MSEIQIRAANPDDIDAMTELDEICFSSPWSRASFEAELTTNRLAWYLVAEELHELQSASEDAATEDEDSRIIGYAGLWAIEDEGHITNVAVHPDFRRKHLGSILVGMLIDETKKEGLKRFTLEVRASNRAAISLYEKFGFVSAGVRKGYYEDNNEDAMIMWLETEEL
jgi:[ribosomal protein S18]-alanine N-acetyltransferase